MSARFVIGLCLLGSASGCSSSETAEAPRDAGVEATADALPPPMEAGARIRTIETRNPFGDTTHEQNLLVDGDFELTAGSGQYGWQAVSASAQAAIPRETGGLCHSGVSCAKITPDFTLLAFGAAPRNKPIEVSLWVKPPVADCSLSAVSLISCDSVIASTIASIPTETDLPDDTGWCHHYAIVPPTTLRPCLLVVSLADAGTQMLIDHGSMLAADGSGSSPLMFGAPSPELYARAVTALRVIHEHTLIGRAPPSRP